MRDDIFDTLCDECVAKFASSLLRPSYDALARKGDFENVESQEKEAELFYLGAETSNYPQTERKRFNLCKNCSPHPNALFSRSVEDTTTQSWNGWRPRP